MSQKELVQIYINNLNLYYHISRFILGIYAKKILYIPIKKKQRRNNINPRVSETPCYLQNIKTQNP